VMKAYFRYLDELRENGVTNMFAAPSYLRSTFGITRREALDATAAWMKTYGDGTKTVEERIALAEAARPR
jgi:hypothetical protein